MRRRGFRWAQVWAGSLIMLVGLFVIASSGPPSAAATSGSPLFGISHVVAQLKPSSDEWLIAGMAPDPEGSGMLDLVLGGAVRRNGRWQVTMLDRYWTAVVKKPAFDFEVRCKSQVVRSHSAIVVGCLNGGSDFESFVIVLSLERKLPRIDLAVTCGQTKWAIDDGSLVLISSTLRGGGADPGSPQPDITLDWGSPYIPDMQPQTQAEDATFTKDCTALNYEAMGPL